MSSAFGAKPPVWFWIVSGVLVLWELLGCLSLYLHIAVGPMIDPKHTQWDLDYFAALPAWFVWDYLLAVGAGLLGGIALLMRSKFARPLFIASLIGVVIQFGWVFLFTDMIAHKGFWVVYFPAFIFAMGVFQLWFANLSIKRGWIS